MSKESDLQELLDYCRKDYRFLLSLTAGDQHLFAAVIERIEGRGHPLTAERMRTSLKELTDLIAKWNSAPEPQSDEGGPQVRAKCWELIDQLKTDLARGLAPR
jgi:hypothetical protein